MVRQNGTMSWIAPPVTRIAEPQVADERTMLLAWLEWHRATLLWKCVGLTAEQLAEQAVPPSDLSLLGLVRHMTNVERSWFLRRFRGQDVEFLYRLPDIGDIEFSQADPANAEADFAMLVSEWELCRSAIEDASLDDTFVHSERGKTSLRWVIIHMIEEYARHNGHADLLRERIDGTTGD
jgi:hypothetical protein